MQRLLVLLSRLQSTVQNLSLEKQVAARVKEGKYASHVFADKNYKTGGSNRTHKRWNKKINDTCSQAGKAYFGVGSKPRCPGRKETSLQIWSRSVGLLGGTCGQTDGRTDGPNGSVILFYLHRCKYA